VPRRTFEFRSADAIAFADAFRFGCRMPEGELCVRIEEVRTSNVMDPAALRGLEAALVYLQTGAPPALVKIEIEG
jgi:hypothetical protein